MSRGGYSESCERMNLDFRQPKNAVKRELGRLILGFSISSLWYISSMLKILTIFAVLGLMATIGVVSGQSTQKRQGASQLAGAESNDSQKSPSVIVQVGTPPPSSG